MMVAASVGLGESLAILAYLLSVGYLGWLGYRRTKTATDYMIAGRGVHPFVMAMSYGATFISTSAIVGFGGVAGLFGMSLLWLTFLNILVGIFIAFVFLGGPTRRMGHRLDAHTFPELLGRRYQSKFVQIFAGLVIFLFIPLYSAAVLIGGCEFIAAQFDVDYETALLVFSVIIAAYVVVGGLKGVMYTDALQGTIMLAGMIVLLVYTYYWVGGIVEGHRFLTDMAPLVPEPLQQIGHRGWTAFPEYGFGAKRYDLWWITVSTLLFGVGIGVLAQPQLVVRFMTVKSKKELNRAVMLGGFFMLAMPGVAYTVGSLTNAYFAKHGALMTGQVMKMLDAERGYAVIQPMTKGEQGVWAEVGKPAPIIIDRSEPPLGTQPTADGKVALVQGRSISVVYAGGADKIIPTYITTALPEWFSLLFLLTLLAAAMSTLSSQFHALGTSIARDVVEQVMPSPARQTSTRSMHIVRVGIIVGILVAVTLSYKMRGGYIIARATAIFFGLCASSFLPTYLGGLFSRRVTRAGAITSMVSGFVVTAFWLTFIKAKEAGAIGIVQRFTDGKPSLLADYPNWPTVDQLVIALPISVLALVVVSALTQKPDDEHMERCFGSR